MMISARLAHVKHQRQSQERCAVWPAEGGQGVTGGVEGFLIRRVLKGRMAMSFPVTLFMSA